MTSIAKSKRGRLGRRIPFGNTNNNCLTINLVRVCEGRGREIYRTNLPPPPRSLRGGQLGNLRPSFCQTTETFSQRLQTCRGREANYLYPCPLHPPPPLLFLIPRIAYLVCVLCRCDDRGPCWMAAGHIAALQVGQSASPVQGIETKHWCIHCKVVDKKITRPEERTFLLPKENSPSGRSLSLSLSLFPLSAPFMQPVNSLCVGFHFNQPAGL